MRLHAHRMAVTLPRGWEGRILRRAPGPHADTASTVVHLASFPLPEERGDFGGGVTELMRSDDVFVVLFEYGPESFGTPLFRHQGIPRVGPEHFATNQLQRARPGQLGCQLFFTEGGRPFCLYVVAGSRAYLPAIITAVNGVLEKLELTL
jgi:hypothetical protein